MYREREIDTYIRIYIDVCVYIYIYIYIYIYRPAPDDGPRHRGLARAARRSAPCGVFAWSMIRSGATLSCFCSICDRHTTELC